MGSKPSIEFRGQETAPHYVVINYCGGWGYYNSAIEVAERIEAKHPGKCRIEVIPDSGTTGRLEVTVYLNSKVAAEKGGIVVHAKSKGDGYVKDKWPQFEQKLNEALSQAWVIRNIFRAE